MSEPRREICAHGIHFLVDCPACDEARLAPRVYTQKQLNQAVAAERERVKTLLAPYAWHAYNCPKMNDHACTCGMDAVRLELWGSKERPAPEPMVQLHECYSKPSKKRLAYEQLRNKT